MLTDPARAVRQALLDQARARAAGLRILCCIPFHYRPARLRYLFATLLGLGELAVAGLDIHVLTNATGAAEHAAMLAPARAVVPRARLAVHPCPDLADPRLLPWCHKPFIADTFLAPDSPYDLFLYLEDDLLFGMNNLIYWLAARAALAPFQRLPGFVRYEWNEADRRLYAVDAVTTVDLMHQRPLACGDWRFVQPDYPYDALYLLDRTLAERHCLGPAFDHQRSRAVSSWADLERAALGPRYDDLPPGMGVRTVVPVLPDSLAPAPECCIHHLPDTYVLASQAQHARLPLERMFCRTGVVPPPPAPGLSRGWLRGILAATDPPPGAPLGARGVGATRALEPAGAYRRTPPLLIDTTALDPGTRAVSTRDLGRCAQRYDAPFVAELTDARVIGDGTVIAADNTIIEDSCWEYFRSGIPAQLRQDPDQTLHLPPEPERAIHGPALLLRRPFGSNWGHFLLDTAMTLAYAADHGLTDGAALIVGADDPPGAHAILERIVPGATLLPRWPHELWRVDTLRYVSPVGTTPLLRLPAAIAALRTRLLTEMPAGPRRRLFVTRGTEPRRLLLNQDALFARAAAYGFELVDPATLPFTEQMALFHAAEAVIGVKGAALANIVFCRPDTKLILLTPAEWCDTLFWDLASQVGCPYLEIFGPVAHRDGPVPDRTFQIDPAALDRALLAALAPPRRAVAAPPPVPPRSLPVLPDRPLLRIPELRGAFYQDVLRWLHVRLAPRRYLEIGTLEGDTLLAARCPTIAIAPDFRLDRDLAQEIPLLLLFPMTSDAFFARHDPTALLGGPPDLVFIDGLHHAEMALRDFANVERHAHPGTVVVLHDCVPLDLGMAAREQDDHATRARSCRPEWWTGDVWRLLPALRRWRPDLDIAVFDAPPSGLVVIRGLDPASTVLAENAAAIVADMLGGTDDTDSFARHVAALALRPTDTLDALLAAPPHRSPPPSGEPA